MYNSILSHSYISNYLRKLLWLDPKIGPLVNARSLPGLISRPTAATTHSRHLELRRSHIPRSGLQLQLARSMSSSCLATSGRSKPSYTCPAPRTLKPVSHDTVKSTNLSTTVIIATRTLQHYKQRFRNFRFFRRMARKQCSTCRCQCATFFPRDSYLSPNAQLKL